MNFLNFEIAADRGFLPENDPLESLPSQFSDWEEVAANLPKLLVSNQLRKIIKDLPFFETELLSNSAQLERAMMILSYIGHAYVWGEKEVPKSLPHTLAVAWHAVANKLGRPPVLSYASYALHNWKKIDTEKDVLLGNIGLLQNFLDVT